MFARVKNHLGTSINEHPGTTANVILLMGCQIAADVIAPLLFIMAIESIEDEDSNDAIWQFAIYVGLTIASYIIPNVQEKMLVSSGTALSTRLMGEAGNAFYDKPETVVDQTAGETHELVNRFGGCAQPGGVAFALLPVTVDMTTSFLELIALNAAMWTILGKVALPSTLQTALYIPAVLMGSKTIADAFLDYIFALYRGFSKTIVFTNDYIPNILFNQKVPALKKLIGYMVEDLNPKTAKTLHTNATALALPSMLGGGVLFAQLAWAASSNLLSKNTDFILLMFYSLALTQVTRNFTRRVIEGISSWGLFVQALQYIGEGRKDVGLPFHPRTDDASIEFRNVTYAYPKTSKPLFENLTLEPIRPGAVATLEGRNGAGKSTLFKMLFGFAKPASGDILLAGQNLETLDLDSVRANCAFVPQRPQIKADTFKANLTWRCKDAVDDDIITVMREVGLSPKFKLDQPIEFGFGGPKISGGEQQRVSFARALLEIRTGKINYLFFDEGLAALDGQGEQAILQLLRDAVTEHSVTTLMITHDLQTIEKALPGFVTDKRYLRMGVVAEDKLEVVVDEMKSEETEGLYRASSLRC